MAKQPQPQPAPQIIEVRQQPSQALPALVNLLLPGVGQLIQGRVLAWIVWWLVLTISGALVVTGIGIITTPILWLICVVDAARYRRR